MHGSHLFNELLAMIYCNDNHKLICKQNIPKKVLKTLYMLLWLNGKALHS